MIVIDRRRDHQDPPDLHPDPAEAHLRQGDVRDDRRRQVRGPAGRHRASTSVVEYSDRRSPSTSCATPITGARRASRTRSSSRSSSTPDTMVQALKNGDIDYARGVPMEQFNALKEDPASRPSPASRTAGSSSASTTTGPAPARRSRAAVRRPRPSRTPPSATPLGYAIDKQELVDEVLGGYGDIGTTDVPPVLQRTPTRHSPGTPNRPTRARSTSSWPKQKLDAAGYKLDANGERLDKEGKPISLHLVMPGLESDLPGDRRSSSRTGSAARDQGQVGRDRGELALRHHAAARGRRRWHHYTADYDLFIWGWVGGPDPNVAAPDLSCATRSGRRPTRSGATPSSTSSTTQQNTADDDQDRKTHHRPDAEHFYDQAPYHILYYDDELRRLPDRQVRRLAEPAARHRHAAVRLQLHQLHVPDRRQARDAGPSVEAPAASATASGGAAAGAAPRHRGGTGRGRSIDEHAIAAHRRGALSSSSPSLRRGVIRAGGGRPRTSESSPRTPPGGPDRARANRWARRYLPSRLGQAVVTIFLIVLLNFVLFRMMPGSPERVLPRNPHICAAGRWPTTAGRGGVSTSRCSRTSSSTTSRRRPRATSATRSSTTGQPVVDVLAAALLADAHPVRARRDPRGRPRARPRRVFGLETRRPGRLRRQRAQPDPVLDAVLRHRHAPAGRLRDRAGLVPDVRDAVARGAVYAGPIDRLLDFARPLHRCRS